METADKDAGTSGRRIADMLPEIVAFLLAFGNVLEKVTLDLYFVFSSCEELHPFEVDCGTDSKDVQVRLRASNDDRLCFHLCISVRRRVTPADWSLVSGSLSVPGPFTSLWSQVHSGWRGTSVRC